MGTGQFLEYLHDDQATRVLAEELGELLAWRGRGDLVPDALRTVRSRPIAS